ncbi:MAG: ABC transporter substrate-binding protein, partial [Candidatus Dormibacteria bacterium]
MKTSAISVAMMAVLVGCAQPVAPQPARPLHVGAVYPLSGTQADGAGELAGVQLAAHLVNEDGGVRGRTVEI